MRHSIIGTAIAAIAALAAAACEPAGGDPATSDGASQTASAAVQTSDSAGVPIHRVRWADAIPGIDTLQLTAPSLTIGVTSGDPDYQFERIAAVVPLGERGIVVADDGVLNVRLYDMGGRLMRAHGAEGDGPGELRAISNVFPYLGDSIAVYDRRTGRITIFPPGDGSSRTFLVRAGEQAIDAVLGSLPDGRFVTRDGGSSQGGLHRPPDVLMTHSSTGARDDSLGAFLGHEAFSYSGNGVVARLFPPLPLETFTRMAGDRAIVADAATSGFEVWRSDGSVIARWLSDEPRRPADPAFNDAHRDSMLANNRMPERGGMNAAWAAAIRGMPYPDSLPFYSNVLADDEGRVWLRRDRLDRTSPVWAVIDPDGRLARFVRAPMNVTVLAVSPTKAFAVATDELGVQRVQVYELPRR